ncbi:hypothetical protein [Granulicella mallensis]|uniref:Uncharacterized protein n=1 Tax=Granulicella mallensis TaxID=940614 RepID=A0A7W7ZPF8_9BACT|nr:hypothetical protein [Granulicella mallensis]MBB5063327.1 hypothetical protein [Granulicella mallensis]
MRPTHKLALLCTLMTATGCRHPYVVPEEPMPPDTVLLSQMMRELSAQPGFTDALLAQIDKGGKKGPALLTPALIDELRKRILGKDWQGLDRFPGWTMREINPTVRVVGHVAGKSPKLEATAAVHPGARATTEAAKQFLDLGPYDLDRSETVELDRPSTLPGFTTDGLVTTLGAGVTRGDGPNDLAPEHTESQRLADVLNRLSANLLPGSTLFAAKVQGHSANSPQDLIAALVATGHEVTVGDARYFANFGHFHYQGKDVMMPFWVNSQIVVPHSGGRPLLIPVSHAEYEWHIRGPHLNADVSYYFGIDGKSEWRTMDTLDQPWVLKRNAHEYRGADAVEVTRLAGLLTVAYMHQHDTRPELPFGGYYALGVCQDGVSAIEQKMTGRVTLFPNTADSSLFNDPRDAEINALIAAIPKDRAGAEPEPERIFGSLPAAPAASPDQAFNAITIPGLADDLNATYKAWQDGTLERTGSTWRLVLKVLLALAFVGGAFVGIRKLRH